MSNTIDSVGGFDPSAQILSMLTQVIAKLEKQKFPDSPYLTAREAAEYLGISYDHFRHKAHLIRQQPGTRRYRREDLDEFAAAQKPRRKKR